MTPAATMRREQAQPAPNHPGRRLGDDERGFTLPFALIAVAISIAAVTSVATLATHLRTIGKAEDGERVYYALDAAVETTLVDLVRGADGTDASYTPPAVTVNGTTPAVTVEPVGAVATPTPTQQYFDPGVRHPDLLNRTGDTSYILHLPHLYPSQGGVTSVLDVNWAFTLSGASSSVDGVRIRLFDNQAGLTPGLNAGCPSGVKLAQANRGFTPEGSFNVRLGGVEITQAGTYTLAFCTSTLVGTFTTHAFKPSGGLEDTWIYGISFKDYKVTADAEGSSVTAYVRQVPGPTEPPAGDWADDNISWIANTVTPYQWER